MLALVLSATFSVAEAGNVAAAVPPPSLFGLDLGSEAPDPYLSAKDIQTAKAAGAKWVRITIPWSGVENPGEGKYDFHEFDRYVRQVTNAGLGIDAMVTGAPRYACRDRRPQAELFSCPPKLPKYKSAYERFLRTLVRRYRRDIKHWEIWNEPNDQTFWTPGPNPREYAQLLKVAYRAIKRTDRSAQVLMAAVGPIPDDNSDEIGATGGYYPYMAFTEKTLEALRGAAAFDLMAIHPYRGSRGISEPRSIALEKGARINTTFKDELLLYRDLFNRYGYPNTKLWITEMGWGAAEDDRVEGWLVTNAKQAQLLEELYTQVQNDPELHFVQTVFWWNLRDLPAEASSFQDQFIYFGLVRRDYSPKPAFEAYRRLAAGQ